MLHTHLHPCCRVGLPWRSSLAYVWHRAAPLCQPTYVCLQVVCRKQPSGLPKAPTGQETCTHQLAAGWLARAGAGGRRATHHQVGSDRRAVELAARRRDGRHVPAQRCERGAGAAAGREREPPRRCRMGRPRNRDRRLTFAALPEQAVAPLAGRPRTWQMRGSAANLLPSVGYVFQNPTSGEHIETKDGQELTACSRNRQPPVIACPYNPAAGCPRSRQLPAATHPSTNTLGNYNGRCRTRQERGAQKGLWVLRRRWRPTAHQGGSPSQKSRRRPDKKKKKKRQYIISQRSAPAVQETEDVSRQSKAAHGWAVRRRRRYRTGSSGQKQGATQKEVIRQEAGAQDRVRAAAAGGM